jgi:DNA-binding transcriptional LysR family regulator
MTAAVGRPVEITVIEAEPEEALPAIRDGRADLALVYHFHTSEPPPGWPAVAGAGTYVPLVADPLRLLVPAGHPLAGRAVASLADVADERWIQGWGDVGEAIDMLAALSGFRPQVACRSSDYRFISALVGVGVGVALVSSLALTGSPQVRDLPVTPALTRYIGAWLPRRHQPNPAAEQLLTALRAQAGLLFAAGGAPQADREGQSGYQRQQPPGGQPAPGQGVGDGQAGDNRQGEEPVVADDEVVPEGGEGLKPR